MHNFLYDLLSRAMVDIRALRGISLASCERCGQPLYLIQRAHVLDPDQATPLTQLAQAGDLLALIYLPFAAYQVWPISRVLSLAQSKTLCEESRRNHSCSPA